MKCKKYTGDIMNKQLKYKELINDLEELNRIDGYTIYQSEANDKDCYTATNCFYEYKELAIKYNVNYNAYDMAEDYKRNEDKSKYEWWDCVGSISWEINRTIKSTISNLIGGLDE